MSDKHTSQSNDLDNSSQHEMHEGQEVSLGIRPNHLKQQAGNRVTGHENHSHPQNVEHAFLETPNNHNLNPGQNHHNAPKINLHQSTKADLQSRVSPHRPPKKPKRVRETLRTIRSHKHWHNAKLIVGTILVFVLVFNSQWFISQFMYLFNNPKSTQTAPSTVEAIKPSITPEAEVVGPQNEIIIPKIGLTAPIVFIDTNKETEVLKALQNGVVHYYGTAYPGEVGNTAFFGHSSNDWWEPGNYKFVFVLLEKLSVGDVYEIHYNSRKYVYKVTQTKIVPPNDLSVLNQTSKPTSTLITCTPPGTSWQRFVVVADQIEPIPQGTQKPSEAKTEVKEIQKLPSAPPSLWQQIKNLFLGATGSDNNSSSSEKQNIQSPNRLPEIN